MSRGCMYVSLSRSLSFSGSLSLSHGMELLGPTTATYTFALPKIFSPQVIVRDGRGCFDSRITNSGHLESVSGIPQERRSYCADGFSSCCHHHANSRSYRASQANSWSCHHANSHSCRANHANSHAATGCRHVNSLSRYVNYLSCHTNSLSCHTKSRPCRANSPSCHANSLSGYADSQPRWPLLLLRSGDPYGASRSARRRGLPHDARLHL